MDAASGASTLVIVLDFEQGQVSFRVSRLVRGRVKETVADIPGLFPSATIVACFGGRDQKLVLESCSRGRTEGGDAGGARRVRDVFADAMGAAKVAPVAFSAPSVSGTYDEQVREIASSMESSM